MIFEGGGGGIGKRFGMNIMKLTMLVGGSPALSIVILFVLV